MSKQLHLEYDNVYNPSISKYNGASGKIEAFVNMGPTLPPERKGRSTMEELQAKFDELEAAGVFAKPEQANFISCQKAEWREQTRDLLRRGCPVQQTPNVAHAECRQRPPHVVSMAAHNHHRSP